jgi:hypothetical protein
LKAIALPLITALIAVGADQKINTRKLAHDIEVLEKDIHILGSGSGHTPIVIGDGSLYIDLGSPDDFSLDGNAAPQALVAAPSQNVAVKVSGGAAKNCKNGLADTCKVEITWTGTGFSATLTFLADSKGTNLSWSGTAGFEDTTAWRPFGYHLRMFDKTDRQYNGSITRVLIYYHGQAPAGPTACTPGHCVIEIGY